PAARSRVPWTRWARSTPPSRPSCSTTARCAASLTSTSTTRTSATSTTWPRRSRTATRSASFPPWPGADMDTPEDLNGADDGGEGADGAAVFPLIPPELPVHPLLLALLHCVVFVDGSTDEIIDPGAADEAMQYVATYLHRLKGPLLRQMREDLSCL